MTGRMPPPRTAAARAALDMALRDPVRRRAWLAELVAESDRRIRSGRAKRETVEHLARAAAHGRQVLEEGQEP